MTDEVFDLKMTAHADSLTIRGYLKALLTELWCKGEGFSAKRPFGYSGWQYDLYAPLIRAGLVAGRFDEDGCIEDVDARRADGIIAEATKRL